MKIVLTVIIMVVLLLFLTWLGMMIMCRVMKKSLTIEIPIFKWTIGLTESPDDVTTIYVYKRIDNDEGTGGNI